MSTLNHHKPAPTRLLPELLDLAAAELYHETRTPSHFAACALVCKEFHASFSPFVFQEIDIRNIEILKRFATLLRSSPHIGAYVRVLGISSDSDWEEWEEDFSTIAHRLINLQDLNFFIKPPQILAGHTDIFRRAITCILSYPSIRFMSLRGETILAISPRLLLASVEKIYIDGSWRARTNYDPEYWENLNAAYINLLDPSAAKERLEAPTKCRSLKYTWDYDYPITPVWLSYVVAVQPTAFANLTTLDMDLTHDHPNVQAFLALAGAGVRILRVTVAYGPTSHLPLDLSHNKNLQELTLYYKRDCNGTNFINTMPQEELSIVETSLKSVNAPSLRKLLIIIMNLECCRGQFLQQSPHLQRFDASFADFIKRHPHLRHLKLPIGFVHPSGCRTTCRWSHFNDPSDHQAAFNDNFPFLTTEKPAHLEVDFSLDFSYGMLP